MRHVCRVGPMVRVSTDERRRDKEELALRIRDRGRVMWTNLIKINGPRASWFHPISRMYEMPLECEYYSHNNYQRRSINQKARLEWNFLNNYHCEYTFFLFFSDISRSGNANFLQAKTQREVFAVVAATDAMEGMSNRADGREECAMNLNATGICQYKTLVRA